MAQETRFIGNKLHRELYAPMDRFYETEFPLLAQQDPSAALQRLTHDVRTGAGTRLRHVGRIVTDRIPEAVLSPMLKKSENTEIAALKTALRSGGDLPGYQAFLARVTEIAPNIKPTRPKRAKSSPPPQPA